MSSFDSPKRKRETDDASAEPAKPKRVPIFLCFVERDVTKGIWVTSYPGRLGTLELSRMNGLDLEEGGVNEELWTGFTVGDFLKKLDNKDPEWVAVKMGYEITSMKPCYTIFISGDTKEIDDCFNNLGN